MGIESEVRNGIRYIYLNHPPVNALGTSELKAILQILESSREKVVALQSTQKLFSAGLSVEDHLPERVEEMLELFSQLILGLIQYPGVTAALVHKGCYGGATELAFACDLVLATSDALFSQPEIQLAVFPPVACALYPFLMPLGLAKEMVFLGGNYKASELQALCIVQKVFEKKGWPKEAHDYLQAYTKHSGFALKYAKKAFLLSDLVAERLAKANRIYLEELMKGEDPLEGLKAFLEKRSPKWKDR